MGGGGEGGLGFAAFGGSMKGGGGHVVGVYDTCSLDHKGEVGSVFRETRWCAAHERGYIGWVLNGGGRFATCNSWPSDGGQNSLVYLPNAKARKLYKNGLNVSCSPQNRCYLAEKLPFNCYLSRHTKGCLQFRCVNCQHHAPRTRVGCPPTTKKSACPLRHLNMLVGVESVWNTS